jgi:hypothetical protein
MASTIVIARNDSLLGGTALAQQDRGREIVTDHAVPKHRIIDAVLVGVQPKECTSHAPHA